MSIGVACLAVACTYLMLRGAAGDPPQPPTFAFEHPEEWVPRLRQGDTVKLVRLERTALDESRDPLGGEQELVRVGEITSLGPLEEEDFRYVELMFLGALRASEEQLRGMEITVDPQNSIDLQREALLIEHIELQRAIVDAFRRGIYFVEAEYGDHQSTSALTFQELCTFKEGKPLNVCVVVENARYPELQNAREYYQTVMQFHLSEVARKFNELAHDVRQSLVSRRDEIRAKQEKTPDDRAFLLASFPRGVFVDRTSLIMSVESR